MEILHMDLEEEGPAQPRWPHYGKLKSLKGMKKRDPRHCHLERGKPTFVACWEVKDKKRKILEVFYVGTHEKAPY